jgi:hypothetical protein
LEFSIKLLDLFAETIMEFIFSVTKKDGMQIVYSQSSSTHTSIRHLF